MADRRFGNRSSQRSRSKMESGTCNVCSAPCSSCMHRNAGLTRSKSDESLDENSHGVVASQSSFNEDNLLRSSGINDFGSSLNTTSEASNLVNSNHDISSGNAENKEIIRSSDISDGPISDGSHKDQDSMNVDSCNVHPEEVRSQSLHPLLSDHQARNIPGQEAENSGDKKSTHSAQSGMVVESSENILVNKAEESNTSAVSESETSDSELLDVNVCDICGDAGREDLLATCSRCTDGAEHTYCMRLMLKKVPDGDWLCEECKFGEEAEKEKLEAKGKREIEVNVNTQSSSKRRIDKSEAALDVKRKAVETPTWSPKRSVFPKLSALSRETSFKGLEKTRRKLVHQSSFNSHSSDNTENIRSTDSELQSPKGSFFKYNSFNSSSSRPKVRPVDDVMLPRQKGGKEKGSLDVKEGSSRNLGKSMSTRCIDVGSFSCNDSKVKGSKQLKDRSTETNPSASAIDQKLVSQCNASNSCADSARGLKGLQSDSKQGSLTKQARHISRDCLEDLVASAGDTATNEKCNSSEQISSETQRKDELATVDGVPRSREVRKAGEKSKGAIGNRQRSDLLSGLKGLPSQKGHNAEPNGTSSASGSNLSVTRNIREDINNGNKLRAAVDAALRKKPSFGKNRGLEQSDLASVSNVDSSCVEAYQNLHSKVPFVKDRPVGLQGSHPNLQTDKQMIAVNGKQFTLAGADAMAASQSIEPELHFPSAKPVMSDLPVVAPTVLSTTAAIPVPEYIWQGDLEVQKSRNLSAIHNGMQAYLSTLASPKVVEVVNQFSVKVTLKEVPRLSTWPAQFQDFGAKEDHVALFFFAKDLESYERSYKPLVDNMIQKDLALKGKLEDVELLIFASNQLPQNCQRWNMLYFLWGVFRGKKENSSNPHKNTSLPVSIVNPSNIESSFRMQSCMKENGKEDEACGDIDKEKAVSVSYGDSVAVEETEEGEIGVSTHLKDEKMSGPETVNCSDIKRKVELDDLNKEGPVNKKLKTGKEVETECSISTGSGNESEKKNPNAVERIVFPLDLNVGKEEDDDDEMVDNDPKPLGEQKSLGMVPNLELALGEEKTTPTTGVILPFMARTTSIEEHRSSYSSHKSQDQLVNEEEEDAASLSLSLSFSSIEREQQQQQQRNERSMSGLEQKKQNENTPLFLFRNFPDKSS